MTEYSGRVELTWTNKGHRLWSAYDGGYEWVDRHDPRVTEVRLLDEVERVGEVDPECPNLLISGDSLQALTALNRIPELSARYAGKVRLVYIDPPFNTGEVFENYKDNLDHSIWLSMFRDRVLQIRKLLAKNGSIWVHLDDAEVHRARLVMDEVFGIGSHVSTIAWQKRTSRDNRAAFSSAHDYILVYARGGGSVWKDHRNRLPDGGGYANPDNDERGPWRSVPMSAPAGHATAAQFYTVVTPTGDKHDPPEGRCWTYTQDRFEELVAENRVYWPRNGRGKPRLKRFPWEDNGLVPFTIWPASEVGENSEAKGEIAALFGRDVIFDTPKPERLLERIIHIATDPGDLVLDCFGGSGTTAAVAHKMRRRWVTSEREDRTVSTFLRPRLERVVKGTDPGGITSVTTPAGESLPGTLKPGDAATAAKAVKTFAEAGLFADVEGLSEGALKEISKLLRDAERTETAARWSGGGGFVLAQIGPSMFDVDGETGEVYMSDVATNGQFALACAAQLGFAVEPDGPFIGRKGKVRLAALDGVVGGAELEHLARSLDEGERMTVVTKAFTDDAEERLAALSKGSRLRHAPNDLVGGRIR